MPPGRPRAVEVVVPVVIDPLTLANEQLTFKQFYSLTRDVPSSVNFAAARGLISNSRQCVPCNVRMRLHRTVGEIDLMQWRCPTCLRKASMRRGSFFEKSRLSLPVLLEIMFLWSKEMSLKVVIRECQISHQTGVDWFNFCRDICAWHVAAISQPLGGFGANGRYPNIVEIDESLMFHRKYHRGGHLARHGWYFGCVERYTGRCYFKSVRFRDAWTLLPLIRRHILPGTQIISDGWAAYRGIGRLGMAYVHDIVVHDVGFVNPLDSNVHTNTIEGLWSLVKKKFRAMHGTSQANFRSYINEFVWRRDVAPAGSYFSSFVVSVRGFYPV